MKNVIFSAAFLAACGTAPSNSTPSPVVNAAVSAADPSATPSVGPQGPQGAQGATGATGANGIDGAVGATGPTGATGAAGTNGAQGIQGIQGVAGTNGTNGTNGAAGAAGTNGTNGAAGAAGTNGTNGAAGATGAAGAAGASGYIGLYNAASTFIGYVIDASDNSGYTTMMLADGTYFKTELALGEWDGAEVYFGASSNNGTCMFTTTNCVGTCYAANYSGNGGTQAPPTDIPVGTGFYDGTHLWKTTGSEVVATSKTFNSYYNNGCQAALATTITGALTMATQATLPATFPFGKLHYAEVP
jgi:hypothetical protein